VARHIFILRRVRLKILELWSSVVLCCVALRWWPASIPALKVVAPFCFCCCCCLERGSFVYLGRNNDSVRFDSIWHPTRTFLPLNTFLASTSICSCPKHRLDSGQRPIKTLPSSSLCFSSSQSITSHQDQQQRTIPSITISTQQLHLA
jgi:hypothetical protein